MSPSPHRRRRQQSSSEADGQLLASLLSLLESAPALLWEADTKLRFRFVTGAAMSAIGISETAYLGKNIEELFASASFAHRAFKAHELALLGEGASFEAEVYGRDLRATVKPSFGPDGKVIGVIGIALDMTERMVAERALRLSEHNYRSLIEDAPYAICRATVSGELLQVNRAMTDMLGYEAAGAELLLRDLPDIFSPPGSFAGFQAGLLETGAHAGAEASWRCRNGHLLQVWVSGRTIRDAAGRISHLDIFAENITEKKRMEVELGQAKRMQALGQLAGGVAHDFNNLLTVISGYTEMLLGGAVADSDRQALVAVGEAAEKAAALTKQMLAFSRRQVLRSQTVNLNDVLRNLMVMLRRLIKENVELTLTPAADLWPVKADVNEMDRVILNLVVNAQDAMPAGGRLTIETSNVGPAERQALQVAELKDLDYVQLVIRDTGSGMDRDTQVRAFEPFFTTKQPNEGTGLGLSVVYGVVRQSGGCIHLESEPGFGTTFRIYLPRVDSPLAVAQETVTRFAPLPRGAETVLFAEDDASIRGLVTPFLESLGYHVLSAVDGEAAFTLAETYQGEIHLLLSDLIMPSSGGRELAARLQTGNRPNLKVLFISGYAGHTVTSADLNLNHVGFLPKPFSMELLAKSVRRALDGETV